MLWLCLDGESSGGDGGGGGGGDSPLESRPAANPRYLKSGQLASFL
jgi:hypothetical protein